MTFEACERVVIPDTLVTSVDRIEVRIPRPRHAYRPRSAPRVPAAADTLLTPQGPARPARPHPGTPAWPNWPNPFASHA